MEITSTGWKKQPKGDESSSPYYMRRIGPYQLVVSEDAPGIWTSIIWIGDEENILTRHSKTRDQAQAVAEKALVAAFKMMTTMVRGH